MGEGLHVYPKNGRGVVEAADVSAWHQVALAHRSGDYWVPDRGQAQRDGRRPHAEPRGRGKATGAWDPWEPRTRDLARPSRYGTRSGGPQAIGSGDSGYANGLRLGCG
jgi:hypothetical protein